MAFCQWNVRLDSDQYSRMKLKKCCLIGLYASSVARDDCCKCFSRGYQGMVARFLAPRKTCVQSLVVWVSGSQQSV